MYIAKEIATTNQWS